MKNVDVMSCWLSLSVERWLHGLPLGSFCPCVAIMYNYNFLDLHGDEVSMSIYVFDVYGNASKNNKWECVSGSLHS